MANIPTNEELAALAARAAASARSGNNNAEYNEFVNRTFGPSEEERFAAFAKDSFANTSAAVNANLTANEKAIITFYNSMTSDEKARFRAEIEGIRKLNRELKAIAQRLKQYSVPVDQAKALVQGMGRLAAGNTSFRGKNGPQVYLGPTKNGKDVEVRVNFSVNGHPFRVSHPSSFNAALAAMKSKRGNATQKLGNLKKQLNFATPLTRKAQTEYDAKQKEIAKAVSRLQKARQEYRAQQVKSARRESRTFRPASIPSPFAGEALASAAGELQGAPATPVKRGFFSRIFGRGGTRRRSRTHKTRKQRRNSRR